MRGARTGPGYQCDKGKYVEVGWFKSMYAMTEARLNDYAHS